MAYRAHAVRTICHRWSVRHRFTRPYRPQTNGKAERFISTLLREWAYRTPFRNSGRRTAALRPYLRFYNHQRPHTSLGGARRGCVSKRLLKMNNLFDIHS
jgi:transposase InsO family protein